MSDERRQIFFLNGKREHWLIGKKKSIWGLPLKGITWQDARARLQELDFIAGREVLAISGPFANFRAVIGSDKGLYLDDQSIPFGYGPGKELYPVRIELTDIQEINRDWYTGPRGYYWRGVLEDVFFNKKSLYQLRPHASRQPEIDWSVIFSPTKPSFTQPPVSSPSTDDSSEYQLLEDDTAKVFSQMGFRVDQLGYKKPYARLPDGVAILPRSLSTHMTSLHETPYFVMWDCKYACGQTGLNTAEERAIQEYIKDYAPTRKMDALASEFWFLVVGRDRKTSEKIRGSLEQWAWLDEVRSVGCRGIKAVSYETLSKIAQKAVAHRRTGQDPDFFLASELPRELRKPFLG
jgi:hypothetical protein